MKLFWYNEYLISNVVTDGLVRNTLRPRQNSRHFPDDIFQLIFLSWKLYFYENFNEICFPCSNWQYSNIGLEIGLVPSRQKAIIWTNDCIVYCIYASFGLNELSTQWGPSWLTAIFSVYEDDVAGSFCTRKISNDVIRHNVCDEIHNHKETNGLLTARFIVFIICIMATLLS